MSDSDGTRSYLVECFWPGVSGEKFATTTKRASAAAATLRRQGANVVFRGSILVPADETVFCLFDGHEADVREVTVRAGVPFERILESVRIDGNQPTTGEEP